MTFKSDINLTSHGGQMSAGSIMLSIGGNPNHGLYITTDWFILRILCFSHTVNLMKYSEDQNINLLRRYVPIAMFAQPKPPPNTRCSMGNLNNVRILYDAC